MRYTWDKKDLKVEEYFNTGFAPCIGPSIGLCLRRFAAR